MSESGEKSRRNSDLRNYFRCRKSVLIETNSRKNVFIFICVSLKKVILHKQEPSSLDEQSENIRQKRIGGLKSRQNA